MSTGTDLLAAAFSQARPRLVRVAYAIIGSHSEAEDVVADCWFRLAAADQDEPVRDVEAWAVVAVSRMALDVLRSARVRRERYVGPWLPEPVVASPSQTAADPADQVTLDDEVSYALLVVMETLSPAERTAFVLHDLFGVSFDEIAAIVGRTPAAVRQLASRARRPVLGADRVGRFLLGILAREQPGDAIDRVVVNGALGFAVYQQGQLVTVVSVTAAAGRVTRLDLIRAPGKLPRQAS